LPSDRPPRTRWNAPSKREAAATVAITVASASAPLPMRSTIPAAITAAMAETVSCGTATIPGSRAARATPRVITTADTRNTLTPTDR
jgi:hypothetical protein